MSSTTPNIDARDRITLHVGTQSFITTAGTLTSKSDFFRRFLSPTWNTPEKDGSYFLDADPILFGHILQYLRRNKPPILHDDLKGHDKAMYVTLRQEAYYFGLKSLTEWLKEKKYLQVVQTKYTVHEIDNGVSGRIPAGAKYEFYPKWSMEKVYLCPRGNDNHNGHPSACDRNCTALRDVIGQQWGERHIFGGVILTYETTFNEDLCVDRS
ncbi:eefd5568-33e1-42f4-a812-8000b83adf08-CDS [Sclerotinia trifoliorum]|uniref:Eefd5568-33e1-42f4-a812-8000b83adf08-CDS n=1 Tax=Sclerotinia trifoliorum TaxID=28548 RepID=A0A8H2W0V1_9HELO|nr:eefd5568-33e1-42f4-a812-8000b83adf08-CDS [Sclerotinia trifoliorum]